MRQKISMETLALNDILDHMDLIYITFLPKTAKYMFFSSAHGTNIQDRLHPRPPNKSQ